MHWLDIVLNLSIVRYLFCFLYSRGNVEKKEALENLDLILLCLDEIIDGGYVSYAVLITHSPHFNCVTYFSISFY